MSDAEPTDRIGLLRWQFDLTWALFEYHLERLEDEDFLWEPAAETWTLHPVADGWEPDWADTEPDPVPAPTIAWLTWHIGWWWTTATAHVQRRAPRDRADVKWPGPAASAEWLRGHRDDWLAALDALADADLDAPSAYPWPGDAGLTVAHLAAWVNAELMKNAAEIGQLRLVRAAA